MYLCCIENHLKLKDMTTQDIKVGYIYKSVSEYEWDNTFINIDKQYKNGNFKIIVATASIGQNTRSISPSELLHKIKEQKWTLIFDGEKSI
jgi:hypothetical protein